MQNTHGGANDALHVQWQVPAVFSVYCKDAPANGITAIALNQFELSESLGFGINSS